MAYSNAERMRERTPALLAPGWETENSGATSMPGPSLARGGPLGWRVGPHVQPGWGPLTCDVGVVQKLLVEKEVSCLPMVLCDDDAPGASSLGQRCSSSCQSCWGCSAPLTCSASTPSTELGSPVPTGSARGAVKGSAAPDLWLCAHAGGARRGVSMGCKARWSPIQHYGGLPCRGATLRTR